MCGHLHSRSGSFTLERHETAAQRAARYGSGRAPGPRRIGTLGAPEAMSMYVSARPVRRRRPAASRGDLLLNLSGRKTVLRALESPHLKSPVGARRAPSPEQPQAVVQSLSISAGPYEIQYEPVPRAAQQPEEAVPPPLDAARARDQHTEQANEARRESAARQTQQDEREAAARRNAAAARKQQEEAAAAAEAEKQQKAADAKRQREAAAKQQAASAAKPTATATATAAPKAKTKAKAKAKAKATQAASTAPHAAGAITEHEFGHAMKTLQDFQSGRAERTHPDGTPLKIIMENNLVFH